MNDLSELTGKRLRLYVQLAFIVMIGTGALFSSELLLMIGLFGIPIYQVLAAIYTRISQPTHQMSGRNAYDKMLAIVGIYFTPTFIIQLFIGDYISIAPIALLVLAGFLCMVPWIIRHRAENNLFQELPMFVFAGITFSLTLTEAITATATGFGGMLFVGMLIMLLLGPLMGVYYIIIEWVEFDALRTQKKHSFLDLE
ncbi:MAG: hypothetical protein HWD92_03950 [Flavobacteriia bacterium]|nr:hypothetical protein [Flavobacteriia bacterium]